MNAPLNMVLTLAHNEVRLRMRRLSTLFALLAVMVVSWTIIVDPSSGNTMIAVDQHRVLYTSGAMAMGSAAMALQNVLDGNPIANARRASVPGSVGARRYQSA